ncbi:Arginase/deacetylase [Fistulina hepatica ATCC 64428]|uniref:histone deacetylase n=1 Tax=Fistulina hepatica ATCC 64428 TaxID=1128425 RepID=A0A0D7AFJ6_9AGAR|nr:Arginase/deacetylase [Fistulina hepatica ATCC 64428]
MSGSSNSLPTVLYIVNQDLVRVSSSLPSNQGRSAAIHTLAHALGLLSSRTSTSSSSRIIRIVNPQVASYNDLAAYHSREYLDFVLSSTSGLEFSSEFGLEDDCPPFRGLASYIKHVAGASLTAAKALQFGHCDVAICWDGGRHHAQKSRAAGFCYVADCVLAILALKRPFPSQPTSTASRRKPRVMYIDFDLHFSDGVSRAFYNPASSAVSQVLTLSIHHTAPGFFPVTPLATLGGSQDPFTLSIPLKTGTSDETYARIWALVERVKDTFGPDFVIVQCGVDGLAGDPWRTFNMSLGSLGWCIDRVVNTWHVKTLLLGGGGYHNANAARAYAYFTSIAMNRPLPLDAVIPDHAGFPLYGPSFTLDVPAGTMQNSNTDAYLQEIESRYDSVLATLVERMKNYN